MNFISKALSLTTISLLIWGCGSSGTPSATPQNISAEPKPVWLMEHPIDPSYYIGIGSAAKSQYGTKAQKSAQDLALADLASQITVTITSDIVTTLIEKGKLTEEEYLATARSQAVADLEGHEFVDSWQDQHYQYAYYRLSKAKYAAIQARKRQAALSLSLDFYQKGQAAEQLGNFTEAFNASVQSFLPLLPYLNEALVTNVSGQSVILSNEVNQFIHDLISDVTLTPNKSRVTGKLGKPMQNDLTIHAKSGDGRSIRYLPLVVRFAKGSGELLGSINTGGRGFAKIQVSSITSGKKIQILETSMDLSSMLSDEIPPVLMAIINSIPRATTRIIIDVSNPSIYLESSEFFDGQAHNQLQVEPYLKHQLIQQGFHFVENPSQADWQMTLSATATRGTEYNGMYTVFADVSLSLIDRENGDEIYKNSLSRVKGIELNYPNAANTALTNAAKKLNESMLTKILESLK